MDIRHLRPAPGQRVRQPERAFEVLPDEGREVAMTPYWHRRLAQGDVVEVKPEHKPAAKKAAPKE